MNNTVRFRIPKNKTECQYIGFDESVENTVFVFPCQYLNTSSLSEQEKLPLFKREAKNIITLLKRVRRDYLLGGSNGELFQFYSMVWLIQDYIDHGYYIEAETVSRSASNGKINWKKTIKQNSILFDHNNIVYRDFIRNKSIADDSRTITQIYKACLRYSVQKLGFIFGIDKTEQSIYNIESQDKNFTTYFLKKALDNTFNDYKKTLINNLLSIITNCNSSSVNVGFSIYNNEFEYVFEYLVYKTFGTENVKDFYNTYSYYLPNKVPASKLRPDTIMRDEKNKVFYIIDSKYYNFGYSENPRDLPQSSSISKQIGYNHYLRNNLPALENEGYKVRSLFLLPYASAKHDECIKYVGYAKRDENDNADDNVEIYLIDLKTLIDNYLFGTKVFTPNVLIQFLTHRL